MSFDQNKYIQEWDKKNMKYVGAKYKASFVNEFKEACLILDIKQSEVFRKAIQETIDQVKQKKPTL